MSELIIPRRSFLKVAGSTVLAGLIEAPTIARATSLMDINTPMNRLVVGFRNKDRIEGEIHMSMLNAAAFLDKEKYEAWKENCYYNDYMLVRRAEVEVDDYFYSSRVALETKGNLEDQLDRALSRYRDKYRLITP